MRTLGSQMAVLVAPEEAQEEEQVLVGISPHADDVVTGLVASVSWLILVDLFTTERLASPTRVHLPLPLMVLVGPKRQVPSAANRHLLHLVMLMPSRRLARKCKVLAGFKNKQGKNDARQ